MLNRYLKLLNYSPKKKQLFFIFLTICATLMEVMSLSFIFATINLLFDQNIFIINWLFEKLNVEINFKTLIFSIFIISFFKTIFLIYCSWWTNKYVFEFNTYVSQKVFDSYLSKNYIFFLQTDKSTLIRNAYQETRFFSQSLKIFLKFISEVFIIIGIMALLLIFNFKLTIFGIIFSLIFFITFIYFSKNTLFKISQTRLDTTEKILKNIKEGFENVREIKIFNFKNIFLHRFTDNLSKYNQSLIKSNVILDLPKILIEFTVIFFLIIFLILSYFNNHNVFSKDIYNIVMIYGLSSLKIIPTILRLINFLSSLNTNYFGIKAITDQLHNSGNILRNNKIFQNNMSDNLVLNKISFSFNDKNLFYFEDIALKFHPNSINLIRGESGIGKSTLLNIISGLLKPKGGQILYNGIDINKNDNIYNEWNEMIALVSQNGFLFDDTITKNIILNKTLDKKVLDYAIETSNVSNFIKNKNDGLDFIVGENGNRLSGGQIQRILLARALYKQPKILILDEFTSALNEDLEYKIINNLNLIKKNKIIIISSHNPELTKISDQVITLNRSKNNFKKIQINLA